MSVVEREQPVVVEGEVVDLGTLVEQPLQYPPATRAQVSCRCGKRTREAHGGLSCAEVLALAARIQAADEAAAAWRQYVVPVGGGLATLAVGGLLLWAVAAGVAALVAAVAGAVAWLSANWGGIAAVALLLVLLLGGGAKCAGLHCRGCKG